MRGQPQLTTLGTPGEDSAPGGWGGPHHSKHMLRRREKSHFLTADATIIWEKHKQIIPYPKRTCPLIALYIIYFSLLSSHPESSKKRFKYLIHRVVKKKGTLRLGNDLTHDTRSASLITTCWHWMGVFFPPLHPLHSLLFIIILIQSKRLQSTEFNIFKLWISGIPSEDTEWMLTISHLLQWVFLPANFRSPLIPRSLWEMPNFCTFDLFLSHRLLKAASQPMTHNYWASTSFMLLLKGKKKNLEALKKLRISS